MVERAAISAQDIVAVGEEDYAGDHTGERERDGETRDLHAVTLESCQVRCLSIRFGKTWSLVGLLSSSETHY